MQPDTDGHDRRRSPRRIAVVVDLPKALVTEVKADAARRHVSERRWWREVAENALADVRINARGAAARIG
ncbi:MAG: hypothetical protein DMD79_07095 [Candidatus Rokuibacteriota bacterium]|nr:MAG: hypothetical protein DMD79_07095 [Candidatus Rokubacteria bacterium]